MSSSLSDPRDRYVWLNRMYTFGDYILYAVHDEVAGDSYGCSQTGVSELEVYAASINGNDVITLVQQIMLNHELSQCTVLNENGEKLSECAFRTADGSRIDRVADILDLNRVHLWCSDTETVRQAKYLSLDDRWDIRKVVVYELTMS